VRPVFASNVISVIEISFDLTEWKRTALPTEVRIISYYVCSIAPNKALVNQGG